VKVMQSEISAANELVDAAQRHLETIDVEVAKGQADVDEAAGKAADAAAVAAEADAAHEIVANEWKAAQTSAANAETNAAQAEAAAEAMRQEVRMAVERAEHAVAAHELAEHAAEHAAMVARRVAEQAKEAEAMRVANLEKAEQMQRLAELQRWEQRLAMQGARKRLAAHKAARQQRLQRYEQTLEQKAQARGGAQHRSIKAPVPNFPPSPRAPSPPARVRSGSPVRVVIAPTTPPNRTRTRGSPSSSPTKSSSPNGSANQYPYAARLLTRSPTAISPHTKMGAGSLSPVDVTAPIHGRRP
jgi:hypothetical protein